MELMEFQYAQGKAIRLDTPLWNSRTQSFYRKCGYREISRNPDEVVFGKNMLK